MPQRAIGKIKNIIWLFTHQPSPSINQMNEVFTKPGSLQRNHEIIPSKAKAPINKISINPPRAIPLHSTNAEGGAAAKSKLSLATLRWPMQNPKRYNNGKSKIEKMAGTNFKAKGVTPNTKKLNAAKMLSKLPI